MITHAEELDDATLVAAVGSRDEIALQEIYRRHGQALYGLACRVLHQPQLAEDVVQEVFLRLWNEPQRFDASRGALRSFLYREVQSRSVERIRSEEARRRREQRHEREIVLDDYDLEHEAWRLIRAERVKEALGELSDAERESIYLAYFGGHTYREVATLLGLSEGTVKSRIRLGLQKLAGKLEAFGVGERR